MQNVHRNKKEHPKIIIEVLIPDFRGDEAALKKIVDAKPEVIGHNIETVERLQRTARDPRANYIQSLKVLENVKKMDTTIYTKSAIMLGLGEEDEEVIKSLHDLRNINVDIMTIGQYLRPSDWHLPIKSFAGPSRFKFLEQKALELGFLFCASGFCEKLLQGRELFIKNIINKNNQ